jgi:hypothetical protein
MMTLARKRMTDFILFFILLNFLALIPCWENPEIGKVWVCGVHKGVFDDGHELILWSSKANVFFRRVKGKFLEPDPR